MEAIPYKLRLRLSDEIPQEGQCRVMARIPAFDVPEIDNSFSAPAGGGKTLLGMVLNMELGRFPAETAAFLRECPQARDADILFGNELDDGCCRSGCRNASAEIAEAIGMNYAFALEFIGLTDPEDPKGYGGNTLFSRWPIKRASVLHLPQGYNWYFDAQKRIGERVAILAVLDVAGREVGAVCAHLENKTHAAARALQMRVLLDEEGLEWDEAWDITTRTLSYTNHTIMPEALEKWSIELMRSLLPRVYQIIEEIDRRYCAAFDRSRPDWQDRLRNTAILWDGQVHMANLSIIGSCTVSPEAWAISDKCGSRPSSRVS